LAALLDRVGDPARVVVAGDSAGGGLAAALLDDATSFAERASASGVDVDLEVGEDLIHVYPVLAGVPEADAAIERIGAWVRARQSA